jgi:hypothetical protein
MKKSDLLLALQREIQRHDFATFVDEPPSVAQGGQVYLFLEKQKG